MATGLNAYDTDASESVQTHINSICSQLMSILTGHNTDVNNFNSEFQATEVDAMYADVESRLGKSGTEVVNIISLVQRTLGLNDDTAHQTLSRAKGAVASIR